MAKTQRTARRATKKKATRSTGRRTIQPSADPIEELQRFYEIGLDVLQADEKNPRKRDYSPGITKDFATRGNYCRDYYDQARRFARAYTKAQFKTLCELRRPDGNPLGRAHILALLSVPKSNERTDLQKQAAEEGWSTRRLWQEIKKRHGKQSKGGRRRRSPMALDDALIQIIDMGESWTSWFRGFRTENDQERITLDDLPEELAKRFERISGQVVKLTNLTRNELGIDSGH